MVKSHATLQPGNLVSLISYRDNEVPKPLQVIKIDSNQISLKGISISFTAGQIHFLKITEPLLVALGFRPSASYGMSALKQTTYSRLVDTLSGSSEISVLLSKGNLPNASFVVDGQTLATGKNWIHECQNAYYTAFGRMLIL